MFGLFRIFKKRSKVIDPGTQAIIDNIKDHPEEWRVSDSSYFFNKKRLFVFWISCGWGQFECVAGKHMKSLGYNSATSNTSQLAHIHDAYSLWIDDFTALSMKEVLPTITIQVR